MKNIIKTTAYSAVALASTAITFARVDYGEEKVEADLWSWNRVPIKTMISNGLKWILGFTALAAVAFALYGGYQILTAGWDDDKAKKGKTTLIRAVLGLFVILIAYSMVYWLFGSATNVINSGTVN